MQKERRNIIRALLAEKPFLSFDEMKSRFPDVSEMTLRRDIDFFEESGEVIKVRGGCRSMGFITNTSEGSINVRISENIDSKKKIGSSSVGFLESGRAVFIDSGSTMRFFAEGVPDGRYSFITTDPSVAIQLSRNVSNTVYIVGGKLENENQTVVGLQATRFISDINIDIAFLVPTGYSTNCGFTVANYNECELKRIVCQKARKVVMLIDASKFDKSLPYTFASADEVDAVVTDLPESENGRFFGGDNNITIVNV